MEIDDQNVNGKKGEAWDEARWGRQQHIFVSVITNYYIYDDAHKPETKVEGWIPSHRAVRVPSPHTTSDDAAMLSKNIYICWCFEEKEKKSSFGFLSASSSSYHSVQSRFASRNNRGIKNVYNNLWYWRNLLFGHDKQIKMQIIIKLYIRWSGVRVWGEEVDANTIPMSF